MKRKERAEHRNCCLDCRWCVYRADGSRGAGFYCALRKTRLSERRAWGPPCGDFRLS